MTPVRKSPWASNVLGFQITAAYTHSTVCFLSTPIQSPKMGRGRRPPLATATAAAGVAPVLFDGGEALVSLLGRRNEAFSAGNSTRTFGSEEQPAGMRRRCRSQRRHFVSDRTQTAPWIQRRAGGRRGTQGKGTPGVRRSSGEAPGRNISPTGNFANDPLDWVAINGRDPIICRMTPTSFKMPLFQIRSCSPALQAPPAAAVLHPRDR